MNFPSISVRKLAIGLLAASAFGLAIWGLVAASGAAVNQLAEVKKERPDPFRNRLKELQKQGPLPRAVVLGGSTYNFGDLDPLTESSHTFRIQNAGDAPLQLTQGETTCKCVLSKLDKSSLAPGETAEVRLEFNSGKDEYYLQKAKIETNDPIQKTIELKITGAVRRLVGIDPPVLELPNLRPDKSSEYEFHVYSQIWDSFEIDHIAGAPEGVAFRWDPADAKALAETQARAGFRVTASIPASLGEGDFSRVLQVVLRSADRFAEPEVCRVEFKGKVLRRLAVIGDEISFTGWIRMGYFLEGKGGELRLQLKVRDPELQLKVLESRAEPEYFSASVEPDPELSAKGIYWLVLRVSPEAPYCEHFGDNPGRFTLTFDHPRIKELSLPAEFAVTPPDRIR